MISWTNKDEEEDPRIRRHGFSSGVGSRTTVDACWVGTATRASLPRSWQYLAE
jgi:hypothetical protein